MYRVKKSKYQNRKVEFDGHKFDSMKEAKRYQQLKLLERAKVIDDLKLQVPFIIIEKSRYGRAIKYIADFTYFDNDKGMRVVEDVKGMKTDVYKLKKRLMAERYGIEILET